MSALANIPVQDFPFSGRPARFSCRPAPRLAAAPENSPAGRFIMNAEFGYPQAQTSLRGRRYARAAGGKPH